MIIKEGFTEEVTLEGSRSFLEVGKWTGHIRSRSFLEVRSGAREAAKGKTENKDMVPGEESPAWVRKPGKDLHSEEVGLLCI